MTDTIEFELNSTYQEIANSDIHEALTVSNRADSTIELVINATAPTATTKGVLIGVDDERFYSNWRGTVYARLLSSRPQTIVVMKS